MVVHFGPTGLGKTLRVETKWPAAWVKPPPENRYDGKWWDGYEGESVVHLDEFSGAWFGIDLAKKLFDRGALPLQTKGGFIQFAAKRCVVSSNTVPWEWWPEAKSGDWDALVRRVDEWWAFTEDGSYCFKGGDEKGVERFAAFQDRVHGRGPSGPREYPGILVPWMNVDWEEDLMDL